jgi:hypothetical protein
MRWSAWPRPSDPKSTPRTSRQRNEKGLCNGIMLDCRRLIQVEFPKAADAALIDGAEVVFAMGIVVLGEGVESADLL